MKIFSWRRLYGLLIKELNQLRRDPTTFAMIIGVPIVQLILFGLAINTNPKHLPTALINYDNGSFSRQLIYSLQNTHYFNFKYQHLTDQQVKDEIKKGNILFALTIPSDFSYKIVRKQYPAALLEADGTDPVSISYALAAATGVMNSVFQYDLVGSLGAEAPVPKGAQLTTHILFNPEINTQYTIVPGLLGVILTMTLVMVTAMALTREREKGTLESLLMTPLLPVEVIIAKVLPYIIVGYLQAIFIFMLSKFLFHIPIKGSVLLLFVVILPFVLANLFVGMSISTMAKSQLSASQLSIFFFLPSILLSGFAFPFQGMPIWAQTIGNILPLTHFNIITRGIMLKDAGFLVVWANLWPILLFMLIMFVIAIKRYHQTLD